jgi:hypothetical protein
VAPPRIEIDLFIIGAMKAATTSMCSWLAAQPHMAMSSPKEPSIFVSDASVDEWIPRLDSLFAGALPDDVRTEGSTDYTKFPSIRGVPDRVHRHCPEARFVYLMRHPVERTISQYRFEWFLGGKRRPFARALKENPQLVDNSRYAYQLRQWLDCFPPERFLLVFAEAYADDPASQIRRVLNFSGAPSGSRITEPIREQSNETAQLVRRTLTRRLFRDSALGNRVRPLVPAAATSAYRRRLVEKSQPAISQRETDELESIFDADLTELSRLAVGPDLTCGTWKRIATTWTPELVSH